MIAHGIKKKPKTNELKGVKRRINDKWNDDDLEGRVTGWLREGKKSENR